MEQAAEFLGASGQATEAEATHRCCVVSQNGHRDLHPGPVPACVAQLGCPPVQQTGNDTFDHRAAVARRAGQLHLAWGTVAGQPRGGEHLVDGRGSRRGRERLDRARDTKGRIPHACRVSRSVASFRAKSPARE
jgi:hypothetical protein